MQRLGYTKFVAQGGDWGAVVIDLMGVQAPPELLGIHTNMAGVFPADIDGAAFSGAPAPAGLSADEKRRLRATAVRLSKGIGYGFQMGLRPQTLYGIADSPVGLAAYFLDHDARSLRAHRARLRRAVRGPHARRHPRQHHDHLADEHGGFRRPSLLGELGQGVLQRQGRHHPGRRERLPRRALSGPAELGGAGVSQADPLQQARQRAGTSPPGSSRSSSPRRCARASGRFASPAREAARGRRRCRLPRGFRAAQAMTPAYRSSACPGGVS